MNVPSPDAPTAADGGEPATTYLEYYVDPGSGRVNGVVNEGEGATWWLYRGHMYLWQDHGLFGVFDPTDGWCRANPDGAEPGGIKGVMCDVIPAGDDMVAWFAVGWIAVLVSGFYLWYWPGVRRWSTAFVVRRGRGPFAFNMSVHKLIGLVVWVPLTAVAFTGAAFAFPSIRNWYQNLTPAGRGFELFEAPDGLSSKPVDGRSSLDMDEITRVLARSYPDRAIDGITPPSGATGTYDVWLTSGYSPWTREDSGGNVYMVLDQYSGATLYDGKATDGNVFEQAWDNWSFPIHAGDFGGTTTRVLWVGVALSPVALGMTGLAMNRIRKRKRRRAHRQVDSPNTDEPTLLERADTEPDPVP